MKTSINKLKAAYEAAKAAKTGEKITCPSCGRVHVKTTYHKIFCDPNVCKDKYWNTVSKKKRDPNRYRQYNVGDKSYGAFQDRTGNADYRDSEQYYHGNSRRGGLFNDDHVDEGPEGWDGHKS